MKEVILKELRKVEEEKDVKILYACESGSRAWGFESKNSDYDVRFIYIHKTNWYLSVDKKRDVIDLFSDDKELDFSGWDLKKTLLLLKKSNPPLLEWFQSPVVYQKEEFFYNEFRKLMNLYYSPKSCLYHYLHMAKRNHKEYLKGDIVQLKKYFYVLRPVLACLWIEKNLGMVPTEFYKLVDGIVKDVQLKKDIDHLILLKQNGLEKDTGRKIDSISNFLDFQINRLREEENSVALERSNKILNQFFLNTLKEINGSNL